VSVCAVGVSATLAAQVNFRNTLMPQPSALHLDSGALSLTSTFAVETPGITTPRLQAAILRATRRVEMATGLPHVGTGVVPHTRLIVRIRRAGDAVQTLSEDESYSLKITPDDAEIDAPNDLGALHGLETLIQLVQPAADPKDGYVLPAVSINDSPRFPWRGLMVDCGRHFEPIAVLKRTLDGMAAVKLNVFHWHLTEDQGFRIESLAFPKLTAVGSDGLFYTQAEAREIVAYARARGIRVVPEFEMPGHSAAWLVAYPELASGTVPTGIRREFGVSDTAIDPTREETYVFIGKFLAEMATIFPDTYVHIGGDESPAIDWNKNPRILAFKKRHNLKDNDALQAYFNTRILAILTHLHKRMVGWDEVLTPTLPKDVVIQSWRGVEALSTAAKSGNQGVLSAPYYLDGMQPAGQPYLADPLPSTSDLTPAQRKLILGGEVCMWGEQIYSGTIDSRIWPRTAAIAERFWSPESVRDVDDMYRRLAFASIELESLGLTHLQSEDAGLRSLADSENIDALRTFASAFEPVSFGERYDGQHTNQLTALDHFVDAVRPDPPSKQWFHVLTARVLASPPAVGSPDRAASDVSRAQARTELERWFVDLTAAVPEATRQVQASPRLGDMATRADQLAALAQTGHQTLGFLNSGNKPPAGWKAASLKILEDAKKPSGLVRFVFLDDLTKLVNAVDQ
jgi:hexosaminidase